MKWHTNGIQLRADISLNGYLSMIIELRNHPKHAYVWAYGIKDKVKPLVFRRVLTMFKRLKVGKDYV
jgi:hypothetical protein